AASSFKGGEKAFTVTVPAEVEPGFVAAADEFTRCESTRLQGIPILGTFDETGTWVTELREGREGYIALPRTPFYLEAGGQVSDQGRVYGADGSEEVGPRSVTYPA